MKGLTRLPDAPLLRDELDPEVELVRDDPQQLNVLQGTDVLAKKSLRACKDKKRSKNG